VNFLKFQQLALYISCKLWIIERNDILHLFKPPMIPFPSLFLYKKISCAMSRFYLAAVVLVSLNACSAINELTGQNSAETETVTALETEPGIQTGESMLIEDLVSTAIDSGELDIENTRPAEEQVILPITPAVAMTANRVVEREINDYLQNRQRLLQLWIERGQLWFPMIEHIFAEEGVPDELKYLALGESALNPVARSSAGAAGMWQFMPATARGEGLRVDSWIDERMDPELSTRAAAKHLKILYDVYGGNWHLALAGYNCSYRCISRAVERAGGSIENPPSFWEIYPYLPRQTRNFIPKFIAAAMIVSDPERFGIQVEDIGQEYTYDLAHVSGMMSMETAAELAGTDLTTIRNLNPSVRRATLPDSAEAFPLKIPPGTYQRFVRTFNNLPEDEKVSPTEYSVRPGDTLAGIAERFQTSISELQAVNNIRTHLIYPDQNLLIPGTGISNDIALVNREPRSRNFGDTLYRPIKLNEGFQLVEQAGSSPENPLIAVSLSDDVVDDLVIPTIYNVRSGDTLGQISERFDVSIRDIQIWNNIRGTLIYPGQELTLHTSATEVSPTVYRVRRGDNLAAIARRFGVSVDNLKRLNGLNSDLIFPGQDLQVN
tara:strand:+ start:3509 stop:5326 length:1818 start_codon:yes stop_codon:yes gene_type:complete